jgi:hypothetical protein
MVKSKNAIKKKEWSLILKKPQFQMKLVPKTQLITKKDNALIGQKIINCYEGSRYKLIIKNIYIDDKKQLCIECVDNDQRLRTMLAKDCKLLQKPGIRKKNSKSSKSKSPTKRRRKRTKNL